MKRLFRKSIDISSVLTVAIMILLSGSTIFVIDSIILECHECCCCKIHSNEQSNESFKCNKNCCALVEKKEHDLVGNISTTNTRENFSAVYLFLINSSSGEISQPAFTSNPLKDNPQKLFIIKSVFRI